MDPVFVSLISAITAMVALILGPIVILAVVKRTHQSIAALCAQIWRWPAHPATRWLLLLVAGITGSSPTLAQAVHNSELGLTITIPPGFVVDPRLVAADPNYVLGFRKADPAGGLGTIIVIERLRSVMGRERLDPSQVPQGTGARLFLVPWEGFEVEAFEVPESLNGIETVTYNVQVPLVPRAVQLKVLGLRERSAELQALVNALLGSLKGETNWKRSLLPPRLSGALWFGTMLAIAGVLIILASLTCVVLAARRRSRLAGLAVVALLLVVGFSIRNEQYRELLLISGSLRLAGFCGLVAVPLARIRRASTSKPTEAPSEGSKAR